MTTEPTADLAERCHPACIACGMRNGDTLGLRFVEEAGGAVVGSFTCDGKYQGYSLRHSSMRRPTTSPNRARRY